VALVQLRDQSHNRCGHLLERSTAKDSGRRVHHELCEDCRAIKIAQDDYHQTHKDKDGKSDVHERVWWIERIPLPGR
jgi:hypothetical protein